MNTLWRDIQYKMLKSDSRINLLIGINVVVFLLLNIPAVAAFSIENILLSASLPVLGRHFWTPITYMFAGIGFLPVLFNLLWLYWIGRIFEEYLNHKRLIGLYIAGGLAGAIFYIAGYNLLNLAHVDFPASAITGASVSVIAVIVATATLLPDYEIRLIIIGSVKLKWVAVVYVAFAIIGARGDAGTQMAHIGGALFGFIYIKQLQRGNDWIGSVYKLFQPKPKMRVVTYEQPQKKSSNYPRQDEIDRILDKISVSGYDSLNKQEKETLFRASNSNEG
jgi:membrane associated rhomboid family serine protease